MRNSRVLPAATVVLAAALLLGAAPAVQAANGAGARLAAGSTAAGGGLRADSEEVADLAKLLRVIQDMPDAVLARGDASVAAYLAEQLPNPTARGWWETTKCVAAIGVAVASAAVPAAKVLKLKAFIKEAGSVKEAAFLLIRVAKGEEQLSELGGTLGALAGEILGIDTIRKNC
ncbi:hypothetical protein [Kitasatospora sp. NPDC094011]|uniref:hypothetical protein n=1 Tax=Kitasatospora sp. NPDC094011 TaxID=3364090 RepID=UPI00380425B9